MCMLALCAVGGMISLYVVATNFAPPPPNRLDSAGRGWGRGAEILLDEERPGEVADTGTAKVPGLPRRLWVPRTEVFGQRNEPEAGTAIGEGEGEAGDGYVLLGYGIRTVSFLRIQVYVVGLYVHIDDLPAVERRLQRPSLPAGGSPPPPPPPPPPLSSIPPPSAAADCPW